MRYTKSVRMAKTAAKMLKFTRVGVPPRACWLIKAPDRPRIMVVKVSSVKRKSAVEMIFRESMVVDLWWVGLRGGEGVKGGFYEGTQ